MDEERCKRVLLLGAGIGQLFLAKKIKQDGHYLIVIAYNYLPEVITLADKFIHHDLYDKDGVCKIASRENVDAVLSDQHDIISPLVAYVSDSLNLPGNHYEQVLSYTDKNLFRDNCDFLGIPVPRHCKLDGEINLPDSFKCISFPWIIKPADSQSSLGVTKVCSFPEFENAARDAIHVSLTGHAIVEEFFRGKEVVVEGLIYKGEYINLGIADRLYFDLKDRFIPSQTIFPSKAPSLLQKKMIECEQKMAKHIKPYFAIVHSEYLYDEVSGEFRVVESALRGGGVFISSHLVPLYCGIDVNDLLIDASLGKSIDLKAVRARMTFRSSAYVCFYFPEGIIESIRGIDDVDDLGFTKLFDKHGLVKGAKVGRMEHKGQRLGPILLDAESRSIIDGRIKTVQGLITAEVRTERGIQGIRWA